MTELNGYDPSTGTFPDRNGVQRAPSCSGGPVPTGDVFIPANTEFSFFIRHGDPEKLVIAWDGGGACWDPNTCVGSALFGDPVYDPVVDETEADLDATGGLGDRDNPANPVGDYTQVFIPYCTGDLHTGAKDTTYYISRPDGTVARWTIHHRGFDNVVAVLTWLIEYYDDDDDDDDVGGPPSEVFLTGASAGGYGVLYAYPAVDELLPWYTRIRVLSDSANGVFNQDFYDRALVPNGVWGGGRIWRRSWSPRLRAGRMPSR